MYKKLYFIFFLFLLGCSSSSVIINNYNQSIPNDSTSYSNYWTILRTGMPEFSDKFKMSYEWEEFANGLKYIKGNNRANAEKIFSQLSSSTNDTIKTHSQYILSYLFIDQSKWKDYYHLLKNESETDSVAIKHLLYPAYMTAQSEEIYYTKEEENIALQIKSGLTFIKIKINDKEYLFLFDTGAQMTTISSTVAKENGIKPLYHHPLALIGSQGKSEDIQTAIIDSFEMGNLLIKNHPCFITDENNLKFKIWFISFLKIDGIIGWNAIKNMDITLDYKNGFAILNKPYRKKYDNQNLFWLERPIIKLRNKDGVNLLFFLDTGAKYSSFYNLLLQKINISEISEKKQRTWGIGGSTNQKVKVIPEISFILNNYELQFKNLKSDIQNNNFILLDGAIGSDIGDNGKIHIDPLNGYFGVEY